MLPDHTLQELLAAHTPEQAADEMLNMALEAGGTDNITFILAVDDEGVDA